MNFQETNEYVVWMTGLVNSELYEDLPKPSTVRELTQDVDETVEFAIGGFGMLFKTTKARVVGKDWVSFMLMAETPKALATFKDNLSVALETSEIFTEILHLDLVLLGTYPVGSEREV